MKTINPQTGSNLVEFAIVLPLLLALVFGIIDFSLALYDKAVITNAAREGARAGVVFRSPQPVDDQIAIDAASKYCSTYLITFATSSLSFDADWTETAANGINGVRDSGDTLTVTVNYPYNFLIPGLGSLNLSATSVMRFE
jgi:Flp pilus assembly protein TadG